MHISVFFFAFCFPCFSTFYLIISFKMLEKPYCLQLFLAEEVTTLWVMTSLRLRKHDQGVIHWFLRFRVYKIHVLSILCSTFESFQLSKGRTNIAMCQFLVNEAILLMFLNILLFVFVKETIGVFIARANCNLQLFLINNAVLCKFLTSLFLI